ncbi:hypothetical protein FF011L_09070 [Roseimaritima multifibrata]|uniref:Uncharacterized protein n=1 Tax=Roseimaritima multifibrata TaxID=1930274 RepID=A0A517MBA4_9BACT|nr:hypothetical protein [Roseimaritima multifibrata]QDS92170.1 hypothetical protein FF011L_09070 [Roseimaritima multifibrata]
MSLKESQTIEFFGGPIDGHVARKASNPKPFVFLKTASRVGSNSRLAQLVRLLLFQGHPQLDRFAVYELGSKNQRLAYLYLRTTQSIEPTSDAVAERVEVKVE